MITVPAALEGAQLMDVAITDARIDTLSGIYYAQIRNLRAMHPLKMTLLVPRTTQKKPAIVYFPGGGFVSTDYEKFAEMRWALARAGFVVAAAEYRVVPTKFPAIVEDGKSAVRWLRAHADEYGIDPDRIGVLGDSAGGYVVQMLGTTSNEKEWDKGDFTEVSSAVQAVVSIYGLSDLLTIGEGYPEEVQAIHASPAVTEALLLSGPAYKLPPHAISEMKDLAQHASAINHVDGEEPPFLLMHGTDDPVVSPMQSRRMYEALKAKGDDAEYVMVKGAKHADLIWHQQPVIDRVVSWFKSKLGDPCAAAFEKL